MSEVEDAKVGTAMAVPPCSAQVADGSCFHLTILFQSGGAATPGAEICGDVRGSPMVAIWCGHCHISHGGPHSTFPGWALNMKK